MADFYSILSQYYDQLFKSSPIKLDFLSEGLPAADGVVLDVGAATGTFSLPLAAKGHRVVAADYDRQMVARMAEKAFEGHLENHISKVGDMRAVEDLAGEGPYDLIYCIGNTLVHLSNHAEVGHFLKTCRSLLKPGGRIVIQIVNYDRIMPELKAKGTFVFPPIKVDGEESLWFKRSYKPGTTVDQVIFETAFDDEGQKENPMGQTTLLALQSKDLKQMALDSGFEKLSLYGDFDKQTFSSEASPALILEGFVR